MAAPRKENVKALILEATENLLTQKMLADISLAEIARRAGISKGTLYYHYKNKNEILFDITDKLLDQQWQDLLAWSENPAKDTSLHRLAGYVLERDAAGISIRMPLFYDAMLGNAAIRNKLLEKYHVFAELISRKIGERTEAAPSDYLAWLLLFLADGLFIHQTLFGEQSGVHGFIAQSSEYLKALEKN